MNLNSFLYQASLVLFNAIAEKELHDFVNTSTMSSFHTLGLKADFLTQEDPDRWQTLQHFQLNKKYVKSLAD